MDKDVVIPQIRRHPAAKFVDSKRSPEFRRLGPITLVSVQFKDGRWFDQVEVRW